MGGDALGHDRSGADDGTFADCHARHDDASDADVRAIFDHDGSVLQRTIHHGLSDFVLGEIALVAEKLAPGRHPYVFAYRDKVGPRIVNQHASGYFGPLAHVDAPHSVDRGGDLGGECEGSDY